MAATPVVEPVPILVSGSPKGSPPLVKVFSGRTGEILSEFAPFDSSFRGGVNVASGDLDGDGQAEVVAAADQGGGPRVRVFNGRTGASVVDFFALESSFTGGVSVAVGDLDGDGKAEIVAGAGPGGGPRVTVFDGAGQKIGDFMAFETSFRGGARVAVGDVNGDGAAEIVAAAGPGGGPRVKVLDGSSFTVLKDLLVFQASYRGGVVVAVGDVTGDGVAEIVAGTDGGASPRVAIFNGDTGSEIAGFLPGTARERSGVRLATGDIDGDGTDEIVVATKTRPQIFRYNAEEGEVVPQAVGPSASQLGVPLIEGDTFTTGDFDPEPGLEVVIGPRQGGNFLISVADELLRVKAFAGLDNRFRSGVRVASGDVNGDGTSDIIAAAGGGNKAHVRVFDGATREAFPGKLGGFDAPGASFAGGVYVAAGDLNGDGFAEVVTVGGSGSPVVGIFDGKTAGATPKSIELGDGFTSGARVALGDVNNDGTPDIIVGAVGATATGGGMVIVYSGKDPTVVLRTHFPFPFLTKRAVSVTSGDLNGDGHAEIVAGALSLDDPQVRILDGATGAMTTGFNAYRIAKGLNKASLEVSLQPFPGFRGGLQLVTIPSKFPGNVRVFGTNFHELRAAAILGALEAEPEFKNAGSFAFGDVPAGPASR